MKMDVARSRNGKMVMEMIEANGRCTTKQICDQLGMTSKEAGGLLKTLRLRGMVRIARRDSHNGHVGALN